jgi:hypothetical protein
MITTPKANEQPKIKPQKMMCVVKKCSNSFLKDKGLCHQKWNLIYLSSFFVDWDTEIYTKGPITECGTYGSSSFAISSGVNFIERAGTASSRCDIFVAPMIGAVTGSF